MTGRRGYGNGYAGANSVPENGASKMATNTNGSGETLGVIEASGLELDLATVRPAIVNILAQKAFRHIMQNEAASKATSALRVAAAKAAFVDETPTKEEREAFYKRLTIDAESAEYAEAKKAAQASFLAAIMDGTLGERADREPALSPFEARCLKLSKEAVVAVFRNRNMWNKKAMPKPDDTWTTASGEPRTFASWVEGWYAKNKHEIDKKAQAELDREAKAARAATEAAGETLDF